MLLTEKEKQCHVEKVGRRQLGPSELALIFDRVAFVPYAAAGPAHIASQLKVRSLGITRYHRFKSAGA